MQHPQVAPKYKLTYFNGRGLGEGARLLFRYADVAFEDVRLTQDQWPAIKPTTPFGQVPILEIDGHVIAQSGAIYRFLGHQFNLVPKCPFEAALVDSIFDAHKDFNVQVRPFMVVAFGFQEGDKDELMKKHVFPARDTYFAALEKFLEKTGGCHLVGKEISWVDIVIGDNLFNFSKHVPTLFDGHPAVKKFVDHIEQLPKLKKYLSERPDSKF